MKIKKENDYIICISSVYESFPWIEDDLNNIITNVTRQHEKLERYIFITYFARKKMSVIY